MEKYKGAKIANLNINKILVVQTAFIGDVILTLPLVQVIKKKFPEAEIDFLTIGRSAEVLKNHPDISSIIVYEKHQTDRGLKGFFKIFNILKNKRYQAAFVPHRSFRSAFLIFLARIPKRIGFDRSAGRFFFTDIVKYNETIHEIERNLSLISKLEKFKKEKVLPKVYPSKSDEEEIEKLFLENKIDDNNKIICVAPGSVWNTKRWTREGYIELIKKLIKQKYIIFLIGSKTDNEICDYIARCVKDSRVINVSGKLNLLQSAVLIKRSLLLISNDSAPVHLATAMETPVIAIFGPTSPKFGFYPYHNKGVVMEIENLYCRPCRIHGGDKCPTGKFECMVRITHEMVLTQVNRIISDKFEKE